VKVITRGIGEILLGAKIPLGGDQRSMAERDRQLIQPGAAFVRELGVGAPQIMRRNMPADSLGMLLHATQHALLAERRADHAIALIHAAEDPAALNPGRGRPLIDGSLGPGRRDGSGANSR
jgi:hypothetical protein